MPLITNQKKIINVFVSICLAIGGLLFLRFIDDFLCTPDMQINGNIDTMSLTENTKKTRELYNQWVIQENKRIFEWHARSTKIIFWVSIMVTVTGIAFSFWQFLEASQTQGDAVSTDQLEIKTKLASLAFQSRSLATFMMFVSLAYLLIYVTIVYPITRVEDTDGVHNSQQETSFTELPTKETPSISFQKE